MRLVTLPKPPPNSIDLSHSLSSDQRWHAIAHLLCSPPPDVAMAVDDLPDAVTSPPGDADFSPLELADGLLENVVKCATCGKPVLQGAVEDHAVNCQAIRDRQNGVTSQPLKRRLSEASTDSSQPQKKSKIVLHFGAAAPDKSKLPLAKAPTPAAAATSASPAAPAAAPGPDKKNKRVVDVDRQCGVINERGLPCQRSLTCKTHNMGAKRAVPHRSQPFDILLFEWQKANRPQAVKPDAKPVQPRVGPGSEAYSGGAGAGEGGAHAAAAHPGAGAGKKKKKSSAAAAAAAAAMEGTGSYGRYPGEREGASGGKKGKKGIVYVGEWDESDADEYGGGDELVDSEEEVEAVLKGLARVPRGRPLVVNSGGGAGFAAASLFTGRNAKLARLSQTLGGVFGRGRLG
ncbi:hypothetical protein JCM1841_004404 [Sporobolomyces salmonicolor]